METLSFKGEFTIRVRDAQTGEILREIKKSNLVCVGARESVLKLISQQTTPDDYVLTKLWAIYSGTGTTPPTTTDTALETVAFKKACDQPFTVNLSAGWVEMQMTMESGEGNGNIYTEMGLFSRGNNDDPTIAAGALMYSRQIHGAVEKSSSMSIEYTWRFQVTV
jgi:hypothetical protein